MGTQPPLTNPHPYHIADEEIPWGDYSEWYPDDMMGGMRAKRILGPGGAIHHSETIMGILEIDPGRSYPAHRHAAPEVYYVIEGEAECTFGSEVFTVKAGSTIRTPPNEWHGFSNTGNVTFRAFAYWWAPGGDSSVLEGPLELKDP